MSTPLNFEELLTIQMKKHLELLQTQLNNSSTSARIFRTIEHLHRLIELQSKAH